MEEINEELEENNQLLVFTEHIRSYMYDTARWAKFLAIVGFVISGLMVLMAMSMGAIIETGALNGTVYGSLGELGASTLTIVFVFYTLLIFVPSFLLFKYATNAIKGILYLDQEAITESAKKLKGFFRFYGILMIVFIGLYLMSFISAIIAGGLN